ncbi:hypothetical protein ACPA9J_31905 [Pseudomonas aeruginosa]
MPVSSWHWLDRDGRPRALPSSPGPRDAAAEAASPPSAPGRSLRAWSEAEAYRREILRAAPRAWPGQPGKPRPASVQAPWPPTARACRTSTSAMPSSPDGCADRPRPRLSPAGSRVAHERGAASASRPASGALLSTAARAGRTCWRRR